MATNTSDRYRTTAKIVDDFVAPGRLRHGLWSPPRLASRPETPLTEDQYVLHTIAEPEVGRLDLLAWRYYGDVNLWWALAWHNSIANQLTDMTPGQVIQIPNKEVLLNAIEVAGRA